MNFAMFELIDGQYREREDLHLAYPAFFTDRHGRIVMLEGEYGDIRISFFVQGEEGFERDIILDWTCCCDVENYFNYENPTLPGMADEPLTRLYPLTDLQDEIIASVRDNLGVEATTQAAPPEAAADLLRENIEGLLIGTWYNWLGRSGRILVFHTNGTGVWHDEWYYEGDITTDEQSFEWEVRYGTIFIAREDDWQVYLYYDAEGDTLITIWDDPSSTDWVFTRD
jgi:hypothetical protein